MDSALAYAQVLGQRVLEFVIEVASGKRAVERGFDHVLKLGGAALCCDRRQAIHAGNPRRRLQISPPQRVANIIGRIGGDSPQRCHSPARFRMSRATSSESHRPACRSLFRLSATEAINPRCFASTRTPPVPSVRIPSVRACATPRLGIIDDRPIVRIFECIA